MTKAVQAQSRNIRQMLEPMRYLNNTKLINTSIENSISIYKKVSNIKSIQNRTKMLRLIHGDVYCGSRLKRFKLSDNDRCIRCFAEETISHLLLECPYTKEIWQILGIDPISLTDILSAVDQTNIEILSQVINELVFRKKVVPVDVFIRIILTSYSKGTCRNNKVINRANQILNNFHVYGNFNITG